MARVNLSGAGPNVIAPTPNLGRGGRAVLDMTSLAGLLAHHEQVEWHLMLRSRAPATPAPSPQPHALCGQTSRSVARGQRVRSQGASGPNYLESATNAIAAEGGPRFPDINWLVVACKRGRPRVRIRLPVRPSARAKSLKGILAPMSQFILSTCHPTERRLSFLFFVFIFTPLLADRLALQYLFQPQY
ncbi:hypothetical protein MHUMG1_09706 [Metarhizium humberi]|uniref:Uncharacterized protein n=1 Tax=Metarhizium humberi TaxID=2596975 RepID=A0A9P8M5N9_9HYPO|nr:hypothetical protein MHUMG1_09706 [Metarhizium humberi]